MASIVVKEAMAESPGLVDDAASGEFVTITRHGKSAAVLVSVEAAEAARRALGKDRPSFVAHLKLFPADVDLGDEVFAHNRQPSREIQL